jgi:hypothetical protein
MSSRAGDTDEDLCGHHQQSLYGECSDHLTPPRELSLCAEGSRPLQRADGAEIGAPHRHSPGAAGRAHSL